MRVKPIFGRMKKIILTLSAIFLAAALSARNTDPILRFFAAAAVEEIDPYDVERMEDLLEHPLNLNRASESRLAESGLLTPYQTASLTDYRSRHGDILSFVELSAVDGFGHEFVSILEPFVSLEGGSVSISKHQRVRNDIYIRSSVRTGSPVTYGTRYKLSAGERFTGGISISRTSASTSVAPDVYSGHVAYHFRNRPGKVVLGDFNARFGQGLALWNGLSFSGLTSASTFMKRPSGLSASSSFTGGYAFRGMAGDIGLGRFRISAMTALNMDNDKPLAVIPALNAALLMRHGQVSLTHYAEIFPAVSGTRIPDMKTSADFAFCLRGTDLFGELAYDWVSAAPAAVAGANFNAAKDSRMAVMLRYYPSGFSASRSAAARSTTKCSNEYAASLAMDFSRGGWIAVNGMDGFGASVRRHIAKISADFAYFPEPKSAAAEMKSIQIKAQVDWTFMISGSFRTSLGLSERMRTWGDPFRTDLRADFSYLSEHFLINMRLNALHCQGLGLLGYLEGGYKSGKISVYARSGFFRVDNWADRIYVYERDAPGSFNVPAYYGRGVWAALTAGWRFTGWGRMYLRAAMTSYPFMENKKPGRAELKIQFVFRL